MRTSDPAKLGSASAGAATSNPGARPVAEGVGVGVGLSRLTSRALRGPQRSASRLGEGRVATRPARTAARATLVSVDALLPVAIAPP